LKGVLMKKKLLVLLIAVIPALMQNLVFAVAIEIHDEPFDGCPKYCQDG
jgi:hypothetical protein|tara:strand:- start:5254 stop:5400 length:147 start_codon:yes stop_codon:yes gene_type:complete